MLRVVGLNSESETGQPLPRGRGPGGFHPDWGSAPITRDAGFSVFHLPRLTHLPPLGKNGSPRAPGHTGRETRPDHQQACVCVCVCVCNGRSDALRVSISRLGMRGRGGSISGPRGGESGKYACARVRAGVEDCISERNGFFCFFNHCHPNKLNKKEAGGPAEEDIPLLGE